jgi:hypothetical protein
MKKYIVMSLCGDKARIVEEKDINAEEFGFYGAEIVASATNPNFKDWTEIVFSTCENILMPVDIKTQDIYDFVASWCVNMAFGTMDNADSRSTLEDFAEQCGLLDKACEFERIADYDYLVGQLKDREWDDFYPYEVDMSHIDGFDEMDEEKQQELIDEEHSRLTDYYIDEYIRELDQPFGTFTTEEVREMLHDYMGGTRKDNHTWYNARR